MLNSRAFFIVSALLPACFSSSVSLTPEAAKVTLIRESDRPLHCKYLGRINGSSRDSNEKQARSEAENEFRNQAAKLKGNFALLEDERSGPVGTTSRREVFLGGKALSCQTEAMEEANEKAEAKASEQKEAEEAASQPEEPAADEKKTKGKKKK